MYEGSFTRAASLLGRMSFVSAERTEAFYSASFFWSMVLLSWGTRVVEAGERLGGERGTVNGRNCMAARVAGIVALGYPIASQIFLAFSPVKVISS